jgi:hypothetical protein
MYLKKEYAYNYTLKSFIIQDLEYNTTVSQPPLRETCLQIMFIHPVQQRFKDSEFLNINCTDQRNMTCMTFHTKCPNVTRLLLKSEYMNKYIWLKMTQKKAKHILFNQFQENGLIIYLQLNWWIRKEQCF